MSKPTERLRQVEAAVLETYRKENPAIYLRELTDEAVAAREEKRVRLFRDCLKFPPKMFQGCDLLDVGAGTGESSLYYARWGATCTLVEINDQALARARQVFDRFAPEPGAHRFVQSSLFDFRSDRQFDLVLCNAVLHHTADKEGAFQQLARLVAPGGYFILGIANKAGNAQRMLQRLAVFTFARNEAAIPEVAERLFGEHIDRAERFGGRSRRAIIYDTYVNPKWDQPSVKEVLGWFAEAGLSLYSTWPAVQPALLGDSSGRPTFDARDTPHLGALAEMAWFAHDQDDGEAVPSLLAPLAPLEREQHALMARLNDLQADSPPDPATLRAAVAAYRSAAEACDPLQPLRDKLAALLDEVDGLLAVLAGGDLDEAAAFTGTTRHLFRGTSGLGISHYVGFKA